VTGPRGLAPTAEQDERTERAALGAVYRHAERERCCVGCDRTPQCQHLRWAWRWITGEMG
jgi:hypothetical protein